jgi:uncharacterized phage-associated protein
MEKNNGIFSVVDLATYVCSKYYFSYNKEISPIKLQKSLYFLFAYWGGFIRKNSNNKNYVEEELNLSENLFDEKFEAWVYGPVVPQIFREYRDHKLDFVNFNVEEMFNEQNSMVRESIDSLLDELFEVSDFKLVSISHEDNCWKKHFNINDKVHDKIIPTEEIIEEYALR